MHVQSILPVAWMSELIQFLSGRSWQADVLLLGIVVVALAIVLILLMSFTQGREISLWPPKIGPSVSDAVRLVEAKVTIPRSRESVAHSFAVEGTLKKKLPDGYELWIVTTDGSRYWPQTKATTREDLSWASKVYHIGGTSVGTSTFAVFAVGPDGQTLLNQYKEVTEFWKKQTVNAKGSAPLTRLTRDMRKCDEVDVFVKSG